MEKTKKPNKGTLKWIIAVAKPIIPMIVIISVLSVALASFGVMFAFVSSNLIDVATGQASGNLKNQIISLIAVIVMQILIHSVASALNARANGKLTVILKTRIFGSAMQKNWQDISAIHSGDLLNRINNDVNVIVQAVINIVPSLLSLLTRIISGLIYLCVIDSSFAVLMLIVGPTILVLARIYSKKMKVYHKKCQESDGKIMSFMQESIQNLLMIKSFCSENFMIKKSGELQQDNYKLKIKRNNLSILASVGLFIIFYSSYYLALAWGAYRLSTGAITYGTMMAFLQLINQIQSPFMNLSSLLPQYYAMIASAERIIEIENIPDEEFSGEVVDTEKTYASLASLDAENIFFSYDGENIFENTSVSLKKGEFVAIAGSSGIGKSTLLKLFMGVITPQKGKIVFRATDGEVYTADKSMRKMFAYVPQGNMILSGTIRDNIIFADNNAGDEEIIKCAKLAEIWDFIESLENGLDTVIGERGLGLSEGQIQRLAIARALLCKSPVLLLDEATSALDEKTEAAVLKNLKALDSKTCIIISHRPCALEICDRTLYISDKKIHLS